MTNIFAKLSHTQSLQGIINTFVLPAIKSVLEEVKQCFLHHVCYLRRKKEESLANDVKKAGIVLNVFFAVIYVIMGCFKEIFYIRAVYTVEWR